MGDIHGAAMALLQCLDRADFDPSNDTLIQLGDVCDGWSETPECIIILKHLKNVIQIKGNHDHWMDEWMEFGRAPLVWTEQGGQATIDGYVKGRPDLIPKHRDYWKNSKVYHIDEKNRMYCHGGFLRRVKLEAQRDDMFMWDRSLAGKCVAGATSGFKVDEFEHVYLGHTTVNSFSEKRVPRNKPFTGGNVTLMDTGAGWEGVLTIMDVDTGEYWQSDIVKEIYHNEKGR
jgi:serine/threonine protein phosphatase 1